jgi:hypothetical protein
MPSSVISMPTDCKKNKKSAVTQAGSCETCNMSKRKIFFFSYMIFIEGILVYFFHKYLLDTTLCDKVCLWFSPGTLFSSSNKLTDTI